MIQNLQLCGSGLNRSKHKTEKTTTKNKKQNKAKMKERQKANRETKICRVR